MATRPQRTAKPARKRPAATARPRRSAASVAALPAVCRVARLDEEFLTKPFSLSELLAAVKKRLGT
ncbi:MAG: hypothetical protein K8S22_04665 [Betaproteobacteria bacterium]|nr:hypothetical protein [Betaproteobacteria bacterium]